ncbi:hypothetical protein [Pseudacidovorax intermedius]|uniref:hypothetical protein n=1 Tax=Pseudacidovorax intermedius TaxID=433924 RepID=UPI0009DBBF1A|nr:hypothetical protein [Pseudacidovorax intermedius]
MTAIAIWLNEENPRSPSLWVAADSLVTGERESRLIGDAAKILPIQVVCRRPDPQGFFTQVSSVHSYGYAFAGSTLVGQNLYLCLAPLLSSLNVQEDYSPSLAEVADYIHRYVRTSYDDLKVSLGSKSHFCIAIFGWCPASGTLGVYKLQPKLNASGQYEVMCTAITDFSETPFVYLGDCTAHMSAEISKSLAAESTPGRPQSRAPRFVIEQHIADDAYPTIGGDLQLGIADYAGFQPYMLCRPRVPGQPAAYFSYLGRELSDRMERLGSAHVFFPAMT